jgi:hypothetical protein
LRATGGDGWARERHCLFALALLSEEGSSGLAGELVESAHYFVIPAQAGVTR